MNFKNEIEFIPSITNFHNLKNITIDSIDYYKVKEWRSSIRYEKLCNRLYNEGFDIYTKLFNDYHFPKKMTEEEVKHHLYVLHTYGNMSNEEYKYNIEHWEEYGKWLDNNFEKTRNGNNKCLHRLKISTYQNVFGYGFEHFVNVTKENGHFFNGYECITYAGGIVGGDEYSDSKFIVLK